MTNSFYTVCGNVYTIMLSAIGLYHYTHWFFSSNIPTLSEWLLTCHEGLRCMQLMSMMIPATEVSKTGKDSASADARTMPVSLACRSGVRLWNCIQEVTQF